MSEVTTTRVERLFLLFSKRRSGQTVVGLEELPMGAMARRSMFKPTSSQKKKNARINYYGDRTPGQGEAIDFALLRKDRHLTASPTRRWPPTL